MHHTTIGIKMTKNKAIALSLLILLISSTLPTILIVSGQVNITVEEDIVKLAERAGKRIQNLIAVVYADENATAKIQNASLTQQFEGNVTLYQNDGLNQLTAAKEALAKSDYDLAADSALKALMIFREVYRSLQGILETAGLQNTASITNLGLMDAINRELQLIDTIQNLLPSNATQETFTQLETANNTLLQAKAALQDGKYAEAQTLYLEAKQNITPIFQYLKTQAEESNTWRLNAYCERTQQIIQERFRYGNQNSIDFTAAIQSLGYQSESQFMQALQNNIQNAQSQSDIKKAIQECLTIDQMVQQMEQTLNREINNQQGPNPPNGNRETSGSDNDTGGTMGGNSTNNNGNNSGNSGYSGNQNYGQSGNK
jgi:acid phosphatase class B